MPFSEKKIHKAKVSYYDPTDKNEHENILVV